MIPTKSRGRTKAQEVRQGSSNPAGYDPDPQARCLENPSDDGSPVGRVIDVGIAGDQKDVEALPPFFCNLFGR